MVNFSVDGHIDQGNIRLARVWYSSNAALNEGEAVCYNWDYGTATTREASRYNRVETPTILNAQHFAGVSASSHPAVSGGQFIEIYLPGSVCNVWFNIDVVVGVSLYTFDVTSSYEGFFRYEGLPGAGSVIPLQTVTRASPAGVGLAYLMEGPQSGGIEVVATVDNTVWVAMVGGTTLVVGHSASGGDAIEEILDGTIEGLRKKVEVITTAMAGSNKIDVQIANNDGRKSVGTYDLASMKIDAVGDQLVIEWIGGTWVLTGASGVTEA